ncbi:MAG: hypothetical protein LBE27_00550 [Deltaproteobacteria bacterium]|nr:hypothetical protein [Deltaproteobacteria bacterium]
MLKLAPSVEFIAETESGWLRILKRGSLSLLFQEYMSSNEKDRLEQEWGKELKHPQKLFVSVSVNRPNKLAKDLPIFIEELIKTAKKYLR